MTAYAASPVADPLPTPVEEPTTPVSDPPPAAGPTPRLVALPQTPGQLPTELDLDGYLSLLESARQAQLDNLPQHPLDPVTAVHRETVTRILGEVRTARRRLRQGVYGLCEGCEAPIHPERLELRPWLPTCTGCASRPV